MNSAATPPPPSSSHPSLPASSPTPSCPRCGRAASGAFDASGLCVRCAGAQIFAQTITDQPGSTPPIPVAADFAGPTRIGPYVIISELGRGGMGVVYLAQHFQLGRIVALKVVGSPGVAASDLEMRFLREAQTIARLTHPNIVTVHDAGRDRGHAYFAMDYIEDGDLARRLRAQPFAPREAAALLHRVADAIAYSHAAGVLHRDLKPSNILLAAGEPRVADFGLAAELERGSGLTAHTAILGTPHYLAPEALTGGSGAMGVASDVYSLGVILYEMLAGRTPFAGASPAELPDLLARGELPALSLLAPQVPVDLATICTKCLELEPARRYATAAALAEDLRRFLAGEPIVARPLSAPGRLVRWARRRPALAATWLLSFALAAGSLTAALWINRERVRANREAANSAALANFLRRDFLEHASAGRAPDVKLRTVMDDSLENIPARFVDAPLAEAELRLSYADTYYSLGEFARAEQFARKAMALRQRHLGADAPETLRAAVTLAHCLNSLGRSSDAILLIRTTVATLARRRGGDPADLIGAREVESLVERALGHHTKAEALARPALAAARRSLGPDHALTRGALVTLLDALVVQGKLAEARPLAREVVDYSRRHGDPAAPQTLSAEVGLAQLEGALGDAPAAIAQLRALHAALLERMGAEHPLTQRALDELATLLSKHGGATEAVTLCSELLANAERMYGPDHPFTISAIKHLAIVVGRGGDLDRALALMREAVDLSRRTIGPDQFTTANTLFNYAGMLMSLRRYSEALEPAETAYFTMLKLFGPEDLTTLNVEETLANELGFLDRHADAAPHWRHLVTSYDRELPGTWQNAVVRGQFGRNLARLDRPAEAEPLLRESYAALLAHWSELTPQKRQLPAVYAGHLATICATTGRDTEAEEWRAKAAKK